MNVKANARTPVMELLGRFGLPLLLLVGLLVRLPFLGDDGFKTDVGTFEAWAISLVDHGMANFYSATGFVDYPPGYFYVLAFIGHLWSFFRQHDPGFQLLKVLVKLPAVLADLGVGALVFAVVRRFTRAEVALGLSALYVLNPVMIFISAKWGQVDVIAGGLALLGVYCLLRDHDETKPSLPSWWIVGAWLSLASSLLVKPQAAVLIPIFLAYAFTDVARRRARLISSTIGVAVAVLFAIALVQPFHPSLPPQALEWLIGRYAVGASVYDYNSVNAFNLWAIKGVMWQKDNLLILGLPQYVWGMFLVVAALGLVLWRYLVERSACALLESCAIALFAFFLLATRMHERYSFDALLFIIVCGSFARRYLWGALALSVIVYANLVYALQYLSVVSGSGSNLDPHNLWGLPTQFLAAAAVATFFALGYAFLGNVPEAEGATVSAGASASDSATTDAASDWSTARAWFDPREGLHALRAPLDYVVMGALGLGSFLLSFVNYWFPPDKIFDEVYFARAAEEYLQNVRIYENTHPPLSKLLVTLSVMLFGGLPHGVGLGGWTGLNALLGHMSNGDNAFGWRFLDVVASGISVMILYAFAKRVTGSTLFAAIAGLLLTFDGMHFVQSRIATPEGLVVCFSLFAIYAFYRFWIASQVQERAHVRVPWNGFALAVSGSLLAGLAGASLWHALWRDLSPASFDVAAVYFALGAYLVARYVVLPRFFVDGQRERTYPDGSYALCDASGATIFTPDESELNTRSKGAPMCGAHSHQRSGALVYEEGDVKITYRRDETIVYDAPSGSATYAENEIRADGDTERGSSAALWLMLFTISLGLFVSAKWYGVMGFGVSFVVLIGVWLQRFASSGRPALWGNPRGFRLDGVLVTIVFVAATVYGLVWVPDLVRHGSGDIQNFNDVVQRQVDMFNYHDHLVATHPYESKWWEWPLDKQPVSYFYEDHRANPQDAHACCVAEILSLPNPLILWAGLFCVPFVGYLAWRERRKGYALIIVAYLLQWLPWMRSPRITFAYHFYVDIPLICLCVAIALQRMWNASEQLAEARWLGRVGTIALVALVGLAFVFFYPVLAGTPMTWDAWYARMWEATWVKGPG